MKLVKVTLKNFRSYRETAVNINELTTLIGKNDIGKSTILEALDIFFNGKNAKQKIGQDDLNVFAKKVGETYIDIICTFKNLPSQIVIDSSSVTSLQDEKLCEELDTLTIRKRFDASKTSMKEEDGILSNLNSEELENPLLTLKHRKLVSIYKDAVQDDSNIDKRSNVDLRRAIRKSYTSIQTKKKWIVLSGEDGPEIFKKIENALPLYQLFQSDRSNNDDDENVTDPINIAIKQAISDKQEELDDIFNYVATNVQTTIDNTLNKLKELDPKIAKGLSSDFVKEPNLEKGFNAKILSDNGIPINKRGSGVRRLILLSFFRAEVESKREGNIIYAFEEPETSQHFDNQRKIMDSFLELIKQDKQVIITTHTPQIGKMVPISSIRLIENDDNGKKVIKDDFQKNDFLHEVKNELGLSADDSSLGSKGILLLEGPGDVQFLRKICDWMVKRKIISDTLENKGWILLPTGGCTTLYTWVELDIFNRLNKNWYIFMDSDKGTNNEAVTLRHIDNLNKAYAGAKERIHLTRKREIENYLVDTTSDPKDYFDDVSDVKKIIHDRRGLRGKKVVPILMKEMSFEDFRKQDRYVDSNGKEHYEIEEFIKKLARE